jgi:hypothetical protein
MRQRELDELLEELEEAGDGLLDAALDDQQPIELMPDGTQADDVAGG